MAVGKRFDLHYMDENYPSSVAGTAGGDYITMYFSSKVKNVTIEGGDGYDILKITDGWEKGYTFTKTDNGWVIYYTDHIITVSNVEWIDIDCFDGGHTLKENPFYTSGNDVINWNDLTNVQQGVFEIKHWIGTYAAQFEYPQLYNAYEGHDIIHLPDSENYVIYIDGIIYDGAADRVWDYAREFNAGSGDDKVTGGNYHDIINGSTGVDTIAGGAGNDVIRDDPFSDIAASGGGSLDGGIGNDTVQLAHSPNRIENAAGAVVWRRGDGPTYTSSGEQLFAQYLNAAGQIVATVRIVNVEQVTGLSTQISPAERLFNDYANARNFASPDPGLKAAVDYLQEGGNVTPMYTALGGNDVVTLPAHNALVGSATRWDSAITFDAGYGDDQISGSGNTDRIQGNNGADRLFGLGGADILLGGNDDDLLDGGAGADDMAGGYGDDVYRVDNASDITTETAAAGEDLVESSVTHSLNPYFENLTLTGWAFIDGTGNGIANTITGNKSANKLYGLGGDDILIGGFGADVMDGGSGNDIFHVDNVGDVVIDQGDTDTADHVKSTISFVLPDRLELLTLEGTAVTATGNSVANTLTGNASANVLNGKGGADRMVGLGGNDTYHVDNASDQAVEAAGGGIDTVHSEVDFTLGEQVENLVLKGALPLNGTGNAGANQITGNGAANILNGLAGADTLAGLSGGDTYVVDDAGDKVVEAQNAGTDLVRSSVSHTLAVNVENLDLEGTAANGTGNDIANIINGNNVANIIRGLGGDDELNGLGGNDELHGGLGNDRINGGDGWDVLNPGAGRNVLNGGTGEDRMILSNTRSSYMFFTIGDADFLVRAGDAHEVREIEQVVFADQTVSMAELRSFSFPFDAMLYLASNPDLARHFGANTAAATDHYLNYGFREGRPTTGFDPLVYLASNPDLARHYGLDLAGATYHFVQWGADEGRKTSGFDPLQYLAANADLAQHFGPDFPAATKHFVQFGADEGRKTSGFDPLMYLASNADLARHFGLDLSAATRHFVEHGADEGRKTGGFDPLMYLASNADLARHFGLDLPAATRHYVEYGADEGRRTSGFDPLMYLASNADLAQHFGLYLSAATRHFVQFGADESRPTTGFDAMRYLASNGDLIKHFGADALGATRHFVAHGADEGRPTTSFSPTNYLNANADLKAYYGNDLVAATEHYVRWGYKEGRPTGATATEAVAVHAAADQDEPVEVEAVDQDALSRWFGGDATGATPQALLEVAFDGQWRAGDDTLLALLEAGVYSISAEAANNVGDHTLNVAPM